MTTCVEQRVQRELDVMQDRVRVIDLDGRTMLLTEAMKKYAPSLYSMWWTRLAAQEEKT